MSVLDRRRGEIGLGDLAVALRRLHADRPEQVATIAGVLGFGLGAVEVNPQPAPTPAVYDQQRPSPPPKAVPFVAPPRTGWAMPRVAPAPERLPDDVLPSQLTSETPIPGEVAPPAWLAEPYRLLPPARRAPLRQALLPARTARGVLVASVATARTGNEVDVAELTRLLAERHVVQRWPRLPLATLERGCQLLLDFSDSMVPWWEDLRALAGQTAAILGDERATIFEFAGEPLAAQRWAIEQQDFVSWRAEAGRPVLVATDFGIRGTASERRCAGVWRSFVERCAAAGATLIFFVPWSRGYWPTDLGRYPRIVHWHPSTSAAMLRRQRGLARRTGR